MARRDLNLWIVDDDDTEIRRYRVSRDLIRVGVAAVLLAVAFLGSVATRLVDKAESSVAHLQLVRENALLESELTGLRSRIDTLRGSLDALASSDEQYRLMAGLDPFDPDIQRVGIGGPGTESLFGNPLYALDPATAEQVFNVSVELDQLIRRARLLAFSWRAAGDALKRKYDDLAATPSILPTTGYITSSFTYSRLHPILGTRRPHLGLDIVARPGTPVRATANGRVTFVGRRGEYGIMVEIDHGFKRMTRYAHLGRVTVRLGQRVERGDLIGDVGSTGLAVGPHLHYEVLINGRPRNPRSFILGDAIPD